MDDLEKLFKQNPGLKMTWLRIKVAERWGFFDDDEPDASGEPEEDHEYTGSMKCVEHLRDDKEG